MPSHDPSEYEASSQADPLAASTEVLSEWRRPVYRRRAFWGAAGAFAVLALLLVLTGRVDLLAQNLLQRFSEPPSEKAPIVVPTPKPEVDRDSNLPLRDVDIHPDRLFEPYTAGPMIGDSASTSVRLVREFRDLLDLYTQRQGVDDNFTLRVIDNRSDELLELHVIESEKARHEQEDTSDWVAIDALRRKETKRLVGKYVARGVPKKHITVKWGRANQIRESQRRDRPYLEYEIRLARYLGMSLLPTEIGTVETFNQDRLVSAVGARSRYQMMPYLLRQLGIHQYNLRTGTGSRVAVFEEWHPLLVMEPAFLILRAYINTVGHEIPGISAYHTGPGNIFKVYQMYLTGDEELFSPSSTVVDAYMWAVTEGFPDVSKRSSFGQYSRGYVASAYGALRAAADVRVDTTWTMQAERVQLQEGKSIYLSELLHTLGEPGADYLRWWSPGASAAAKADPEQSSQEPNLYAHFRTLNPHMALPEASLNPGSVPTTGDVRLTATAEGVPVRFFLPPGALAYLAAREIDVFDEKATFAFDHTTYRDAHRSATLWDRQYDALVEEIGQFGFTEANRRRLSALQDHFERLAKANPSHYRKAQLAIITVHERMWNSDPWKALAEATAAARGELRVPVRPPDRLLPTPAPR